MFEKLDSVIMADLKTIQIPEYIYLDLLIFLGINTLIAYSLYYMYKNITDNNNIFHVTCGSCLKQYHTSKNINNCIYCSSNNLYVKQIRKDENE